MGFFVVSVEFVYWVLRVCFFSWLFDDGSSGIRVWLLCVCVCVWLCCCSVDGFFKMGLLGYMGMVLRYVGVLVWSDLFFFFFLNWFWFESPVSGSGICEGGNVLLWLFGGFF